MTESKPVKQDFMDIFKYIRDFNPDHSTDEIIDNIGDLIISTYFQKIEQLDLSYQIDRFIKKRLELKRQRSTKKGKEIIDQKFDKEKKVKKYRIIKGIISDVDKLSEFHSSSDLNFNNLRFLDQINSNIFEKHESNKIENLLNEGEYPEYDLDFENDPYYLNLKEKLLRNSPTKSISLLKKVNEYSSIEIDEIKEVENRIKDIKSKELEIDSEFIKGLREIKLEKMEKVNPKEYDLKKFIGLIDLEKDTDGVIEHDLGS